MEKPYYLPDASLRYRSKTIDKDANQQRFYDRMATRGIQVIRDTDESDAKEKKWRGDHTFSPDAATYSLTHFVVPEVAREHPDWNPSQLHAEAITRFEQRLRQDLAYENLEKHHEESVVHWKPIETKDGGIELATSYGDRMITLSELWEHTKEYAAFVGKPEAYNETEHRAQLAMQDEFIKGSASAFISVLSHPDSVRYVQVWEKKDDGEIISKQVDLFLSTGKDLTHEEGNTLIRNLKDFYNQKPERATTQMETGYSHLIVQTGNVETKDIRIIALAQTYKSARVEIVPREHVHIPKDKFRDIVGFLREPIHKTVEFFSFNKKKIKRVVGQPDVLNHDVTKNSVIPKNIEPSKGEAVKLAMSEWVISQVIISHAPLLPAGAHATLFWFAELPSLQKDIRLIQKNIPQPERDMLPMNKRSEKKSGFIVIAVLEKIKKLMFPEKRKKIEKISFRVIKKEKKKLRELVSKIQKVDIKNHRLVTPIIKFVDKIFFLFKKKKQQIQKTPLEKKQILKSEVHHAQTHIAVAIRFLRIFLLAPRVTEIKKQEIKQKVLTEQDEAPTDQESPVWLLLSIIWYLTMLRESGMVSQPVQQVTTFPLTGVIFIYAS